MALHCDGGEGLGGVDCSGSNGSEIVNCRTQFLKAIAYLTRFFSYRLLLMHEAKSDKANVSVSSNGDRMLGDGVRKGIGARESGGAEARRRKPWEEEQTLLVPTGKNLESVVSNPYRNTWLRSCHVSTTVSFGRAYPVSVQANPALQNNKEDL